MSRRGVPEGPLGGLGARGARARVAPVDEAAMQAKLRELRSVMAKERTARTEMHSAMEANGGRIWSSSKPTTLRSRDGGLKLRELTAEELERIQRAKDRAAASDRAAAIAAVTAGRARSRSGRRVLDPLDASVFSAPAASARSRPGSASSSGPQSEYVAEHVPVRATNAVYAPPRANARRAREGGSAARAPGGAILPAPAAPPAPRPPAARPASRPASGRRALSARASGLSTSGRADVWHPDANDMIEPMGDDMIEPVGGAEVGARRRAFFSNAGDAETMTFQNVSERSETFQNVSETFRNDAGLETHARVRIVHDPDSLLEGEVDEAANRAAFAEALRSWRGGEENASSRLTTMTRKENPPSFSEAGGSLLDGAFDEAANRRAFAEALGEWRGETNGEAKKKKSGEPNVPAMETQTESPPGARKTRAAPAKPSAPPGASYFERLRAGNVERLAGKDAADAVRSSSSKQCRQ
jgi:hypothetical protein